ICQGTERRRLFADADVARDQIGLFQRNIEFCFIGKFENEDFLSGHERLCWSTEFPRHRARGSSPLDCRHFNEPKKSSDAVLDVDDKIAFVEFAEINL